MPRGMQKWSVMNYGEEHRGGEIQTEIEVMLGVAHFVASFVIVGLKSLKKARNFEMLFSQSPTYVCKN